VQAAGDLRIAEIGPRSVHQPARCSRTYPRRTDAADQRIRRVADRPAPRTSEAWWVKLSVHPPTGADARVICLDPMYETVT
jgi:hypothetical protein